MRNFDQSEARKGLFNKSELFVCEYKDAVGLAWLYYQIQLFKQCG